MTTIQFYPIDIISKEGIVLFGRTLNNKRIIVKDTTLKPYFYAEFENIEKIRERIILLNEENLRVIKTELVSKENKELIKITVNESQAVKAISNLVKELPGFIEIYENDISYTQRYLINRGIVPLTLCEVEGELTIPETIKADYYIEGEVKQISDDTIKDLKILTIDIETYGFSFRKHKEPILAVALSSDNFKKVITWKKFEDPQNYVEIVKDEAELLIKLKDTINRFEPDFIVGYFSDDFDFPYLNSRAEKYNIRLNLGWDNSSVKIKRGLSYSKSKITGIPHLDLYHFITKIMAGSLKLDSYSLDSVAEALVGEKKYPLEAQEISMKWDNNEIKEICKYNLQDTQLTLKIFNKILPNLMEITKIASVPIYDACRMSYGSLSENYLMKKSKEYNLLIPKKPSHGEIKKRQMHTYQGAFVLTPQPGLYKDMFLFDFRSLYPSIIVAKNIDYYSLERLSKDNTAYICPEVIDEEGKKVNYYFSSKKEGFIPLIIKDLILRKNRIKEIIKNEINPDKTLLARAYALKTIANSSYGYYAFFGARWYCRECAAAITAWAREYIQKTINKIKSEGFDVIYSDTDSVAFILKDKTKQKALNLLKEINKELPSLMELEVEDFYPRALFVGKKAETKGAKKKYALIDELDQIKIVGFETVRRDWSFIARDTQRKVIELILKGNKIDDALDYVRKIIKKLKNKEVDIHDLIIQTQLKMDLEKYTQIGPHVAVARKMRLLGHDINAGVSIIYIISKGKGMIRDRAVPPNECKEYDEDYYINNQVVPAVEKIFEIFGITEEQIIEKEQSSLEKFS